MTSIAKSFPGKESEREQSVLWRTVRVFVRVRMLGPLRSHMRMVRTESLKLTEERFLKDWDSKLVPAIKSGKKILIAAHGNTLRALVKHLDGISEDEITGLNIPTGVPLVYDLDENMRPVKHKDAIEPLQGRYLGNQDDIRKRIGAVAAQTK